MDRASNNLSYCGVRYTYSGSLSSALVESIIGILKLQNQQRVIFQRVATIDCSEYDCVHMPYCHTINVITVYSYW